MMLLSALKKLPRRSTSRVIYLRRWFETEAAIASKIPVVASTIEVAGRRNGIFLVHPFPPANLEPGTGLLFKKGKQQQQRDTNAMRKFHELSLCF